MAGRYTKIPIDTFDGLGLDAGVLLKNFNIEAAINGEDGFTDADIITATTGGVNPVAQPTFSDQGEDVDNVPPNMKELMHLDSWAVSLSTTAYDTSPETVKLALGCADIEGNKITPRASLNQSDFGDIWWVGDKANGGFIAVHILNALSVEGFSLQSTKNGKTTFPLTFNGHVSINAQDVVPIEIYSVDPEDVNTFSVKQTLLHVTSDFTGNSVEAEGELEVTLTAETGYTISNVVVLMGGDDVTDTAYSSSTNKVTIASVAGDVQIIATATK